jgi:hypothetical protein
MSGNHYEEEFKFLRKETSPILVKIVDFKLRTEVKL